MAKDKNQYLNNPFRVDRVDTPFSPNQTDLEELNAKAFNSIAREVEQVRNSTDKQSRGVLILGEAGTGKTHLLSRLHYRLGEDNHLLFVPRASNPGGVTSFIWTQILNSLNIVKESDSGLTQGDILLKEAFFNIVMASTENDETLKKKTRSDWEALADALASGHDLGDEGKRVKNRILDHWRKTHGGNAYQIRFVEGLFRLLTYKDKIKKRQVFDWLSTYDCDESTCKDLGLPEWDNIEGHSANYHFGSQREQWALEAIKTIAELSNYGRPLILAFDQLDGLKDKLELTKAWGLAVQEIMTQCKNVVVVCCIFPSYWKDWFTKRLDNGYAPLIDAVIDRVAARTIELQPISTDLAVKLIETRLRSANIPPRPGNNIYPFDTEMVNSILNSMERKSIRTFLQRCCDKFDDLTLENGHQALPKSPLYPLSSIRNFVSQYKPTATSLDDSEMMSRLRELIDIAGDHYNLKAGETFKLNEMILPDYLVLTQVNGAENANVVVGFCNKKGVALTARLKNWVNLQNRMPKARLQLVRSRTAQNPKAGVGADHLKKLASGICYLDKTAESNFLALFAALVAIQEHEIETPQGAATASDFKEYIKLEGHLILDAILGVKSKSHETNSIKSVQEPKLKSVDQTKSAESSFIDAVAEAVSSPLKAITSAFTKRDLMSASNTETPAKANSTGPKTEDRLDRTENAAVTQNTVESPKIIIKEAQVPRFETKRGEVEDTLQTLANFVSEFRLPIARTNLNLETDLSVSPHVLSFHLQMKPGYPAEKVVKSEADAGLYFKRAVRIYPNHKLGKITFEIERSVRAPWTLSQMLELMGTPSHSGIEIPVGVTAMGAIRSFNMFESPAHLLIGGSSGSGKSNYLLCLIGSLLMRYSSNEVKISIGDVKMVDFQSIKELQPPHLGAYATDSSAVVDMLGAYCQMMDERYAEMQKHKVRKWADMRRIDSSHSYHILIIDEVADLFSNKNDVAIEYVKRLAQKARAAGIGLILCSQHPRANIIDSTITANLNNRIGFKLQNHHQSRVILDEPGAENLLGKGDCLARLETGAIERIQVPEYDRSFEKMLETHFQQFTKKSAA